MLQTIQGDLYDYPKYYDLVYGSDWKAEFDFLLDCFEQHAKVRVRRVFEPACGTGRLLVKLAAAGFHVGEAGRAHAHRVVHKVLKLAAECRLI